MVNSLLRLTWTRLKLLFRRKFQVGSTFVLIFKKIGFKFDDILNEDGTINVSDTAALEALANELKDANVNIEQLVTDIVE